jgi:hypothetical protein
MGFLCNLESDHFPNLPMTTFTIWPLFSSHNKFELVFSLSSVSIQIWTFIHSDLKSLHFGVHDIISPTKIICSEKGNSNALPGIQLLCQLSGMLMVISVNRDIVGPSISSRHYFA